MSPRKGSSDPATEIPDLLWGSGTFSRPSGPPTRVELIHLGGGVRRHHVFRGRGRESSTGRLTHPPHSMRVVEACSAAAAHRAAFVRPHCGPRITKEHSAAACAAPTQSLSAALIGYDDSVLFHNAAYTASYTTRSTTWRAAPLATSGTVPTRHRLDTLNGGFQEQARKSRREISFACNAIMYEQYVIVYCTGWAHLSGTQRPCTRLP